jgi:hypothetical protein
MELSGRHGEERPQATVTVHAERLMVFAAIREPTPTRRTVLAVDVWLHAAAVARLDIRDPGTDGDHLDAEFVPRNPRIAEERHLAEVAAVVGAADADRMHADHRLAGRRCVRLRNLDISERFRLLEQ